MTLFIYNAVVAASNFYGAIAMGRYMDQRAFLDAAIVGLAIVASACYHLVERQKHNMHGMALSDDPKYERALRHLHRTTAALLAFVTLHHIVVYAFDASIVPWLPYLIAAAIVGAIGLAVPEFVSSEQYATVIYAIGHTWWHLSAFHIVNIVSLMWHQIKHV